MRSCSCVTRSLTCRARKSAPLSLLTALMFQDVIIVPLTSKTTHLLPGEFKVAEWKAAGLNVETAIKRGIFTIHERLIVKSVGTLSAADAGKLERSLREWIGLP